MDISSADEEAEIRNFKPSSEWKALLKGAGLIHETYNGQTGTLQDGDPTKNALIKFTKTQNKEKPGPPQEPAKRSLINTFLTTPEWYTVDISQQYAKFIHTKPFYEFPYFESVGTFWKIFGNSYSVARKYARHSEIIFSDNMIMTLFVGLMMTAEYGIKGALSLPIKLLYGGVEDRFIDLQIKNNETDLNQLGISHTLLQKKAESMWIRVPRYMEFTNILKTFSEYNIQIQSIAGNDVIQIRISGTTEQLENLQRTKADKIQLAYMWKVPAQDNISQAILIVKIPDLITTLKMLKEKSVAIEYIHDY